MSEQPEASPLSRAEEEYERAAMALRREQVAEMLRSRPGLSFASLGVSHNEGPHLVAYEGQVIGEVYSATPGTFLQWYAVAYTDGGQLEPKGPHHTARAAAASLIAT